MKKRIKKITQLLLVISIGICQGVCADELSKPTLNSLEVWHDDLTQFAKNITPPEPVPEIHISEQVASTAKQYLGTPYVWGGTTPNGFDCSGLVQYVYKQLGINISRTTYTQVDEGIAVSRNSLKQGDLVFFKRNTDIHHVGI